MRALANPAEIERIKSLIAQLYAKRVRLHQNPEKRAAALHVYPIATCDDATCTDDPRCGRGLVGPCAYGPL
ncbi:MAG: hypothetical protein WA851_27400, partial [Xanthobacteraceae bacterium]